MELPLERKFTPVETPVAGSRSRARSGSLVSFGGKDGSSILMVVVVLVGPELGLGAAVVSLSIFFFMEVWKSIEMEKRRAVRDVSKGGPCKGSGYT